MGMRSAMALVIATVIGVGIFTSTGFQAEALPHPGYILLLWVVGGALAMCGAGPTGFRLFFGLADFGVVLAEIYELPLSAEVLDKKSLEGRFLTWVSKQKGSR